MSLVKLSCLVMFALVVSGCGYIYGEDGLIKSQKYDYITAKQTRDLDMPPSLSHKDKADYTVMPNIGQSGKSGIYGKQLGKEAPIQLLAVLDNTRVDRKSVAPAILIIDRIDFIWQTVTKFFEKHEIATSIKDNENHIIISQWMAIDEGGVWLGLDGSEEPDLIRAKYKITIGKGEIKDEHKLTVERIVSQVREDDDSTWSDKKITWQESADLMNLLLSFYDQRVRIQDVRHQQKVMAGFKLDLGQDTTGSAALLTSAKETLVWEKIPKVVKELGFTIIDKDLRQKTYFMEYKAPEVGFFASLFNEESAKLPLEDGAYQMTVGESGDKRSITLKDAQGVGIEADILVKLYPELSRLFGDRR